MVLSAAIPAGTMWSSYFDYRALNPNSSQLPLIGRRLRAAGVRQLVMVTQSPLFDDLLVERTYRVARVLPVPAALRGWSIEILDQR